jgi:hypothetical protein
MRGGDNVLVGGAADSELSKIYITHLRAVVSSFIAALVIRSVGSLTSTYDMGHGTFDS